MTYIPHYVDFVPHISNGGPDLLFLNLLNGDNHVSLLVHGLPHTAESSMPDHLL
jgi:hypothetical protein